MACTGGEVPVHSCRDELCFVLEHLVLPRLSVADLGRLSCTCKALREAVLRPPATALQQAAAASLGPLHPAAKSTSAPLLQEALRRQATARHNLATGACLHHRLYGPSFHYCVLSPCSDELVGTGEDIENPPLEICNLSTGCVRQLGNIDCFAGLQWSADSCYIVTVTFEKGKTLWCKLDADDGSRCTLMCLEGMHCFDGPASVLSSYGSFLAVPSFPGTDKACALSVQDQEGQEVLSCCNPRAQFGVWSPQAWCWSPHQDGQLALIEQRTTGGRLRIEDLGMQQSILLGPVHQHELGIAAWEPLCQLLAVQHDLKGKLDIRLLNTHSGLEVCRISLPNPCHRLRVAIAVTGLVSVCRDRKVHIIDPTPGHQLFILDLNVDPDGHPKLAQSRYTVAAWSLDGQMLAVCMGFCLVPASGDLDDELLPGSWLGVFDARSWLQLARYYSPSHDVWGMQWSADSHSIVVQASTRSFYHISDTFVINLLDPKKIYSRVSQ